MDAGEEIAQAVAKAVPIEHPDEPDLAFLYGTILTDGGDGKDVARRNVCIFAGRQVDRSPTGSGVRARMALQVARRQARLGEQRRFESCTGSVFTGNGGARGAVGGPAQNSDRRRRRHRAHHRRSAVPFDDDDPLRDGFTLGL